MGDVTEDDFQRRLRAIRRLITGRQLPEPANDQASGTLPTSARTIVARSRATADKPAR